MEKAALGATAVEKMKGREVRALFKMHKAESPHGSMASPRQTRGPGEAFWDFLSMQNVETWGDVGHTSLRQTFNATLNLCTWSVLFTQRF